MLAAGRRSEMSFGYEPQVDGLRRPKLALSQLLLHAVSATSSSSGSGRPTQRFVESGGLSVPLVALPSAAANEFSERARSG